MATIAQRFGLFNVLLPPGTETVTLPIASFSSFLSLSGAVCLLLLSKPHGTAVSVVTRGEVSALHAMLTGTNVSWCSPGQATPPCTWLPALEVRAAMAWGAYTHLFTGNPALPVKYTCASTTVGLHRVE